MVDAVAAAFDGDAGDPPPVRWPHLSLCTDNAAMVAGLGAVRLRRGETADWDADAYPRFPIDAVNP
jgi:N6-L-threonylcarbamoyladenine synthase